MPATFTPLLRLTKPGLNDTGWGTTVNNGTFELIDNSIAGLVNVDVTSGNATLTTANGATDEARYMFIRVFGASVVRDVIVPATSKLYFVVNDCTAAVTFKVSGQTGVSVPGGKTAVLRCDGTDVVAAVTYLTSLTLASALPVSSGGTGITSFGTGVATWLGTPSSANLAAAVTDETGTGALVFATSPTLVTPVLGTPSSVTLTNATGLPLTTGVTGILSAANGGTGVNNSTRTLTISGNAGTFNFTATAKTLGISNSITLAGTDATTMTFPSTSATLARTDAGQTFTGTNVFTSPRIVTGINDSNGNELFLLTATASAVNEITVANAATGNAPKFTASGGDTNIDLVLAAKGTGQVKETWSSANWALASQYDIGIAPNEIPLNQYLGTMAFQDADAVDVGFIRSNATTGSGYALGAGSTVTQATSRTTGVTINAACGAITLVSAAGTTTPASFTVTNSSVAATDVIILSQKSGTDKYVLLVTAVAAGSFEITAYTTGGTTTEQPVINFAVIKAVTA